MDNQNPGAFSEGSQLPLEVYDEKFSQILGSKPKLIKIAGGFGFTEGLVYVAVKDLEEGYIFFTDQINDHILMIRWNGLSPYGTITPASWGECNVFRHPSNIANGQTLDGDGRLLVAETTARRVSITDFNGEVSTLVGEYKGKPFNSPNDLVMKSDGSVWFTDPSYGTLQFLHENFHPNNVYRFDPKTKEVHPVITDLKMPNGIAFSPDEKKLYIADSESVQGPDTYYEYKSHAIYVYDVDQDGKGVSGGKLFTKVSPGVPDGLKLDSSGNIYVGALDGVQVYSPEGSLIGKILMPKATANLSFGGKDNNILFICASDSIWAIKLNAKGAKEIPIIKKRM